VSQKEEADHSLPYMLAVAALDRELGPEQYLPERIRAGDVQSLLRRVEVTPLEAYSKRFPEEMPTTVRLRIKDGRAFETAQRDYEGFFTRPMSWNQVVEKFERLSEPFTDQGLRRDLVLTVEHLESEPVERLTGLLSHVSLP
jgi:2-methylcitrate dehydratase